MLDRPRNILICSCEDTMPLDADAVRRGCRGAQVSTSQQLCRAEIEWFRTVVAEGAPVTVGCVQEAPLFTEVATKDADITFVNVRETAGWSSDAVVAGPKMAALIAAANEPMPGYPSVSLSSEGVALIYGRDDKAIEVATRLKDHLDVTVLINRPGDVTPLRIADFPVVKGAVRSAKGRLGSFEVVVDGYATPFPSSRGSLAFGPARDGAVSRCDILLDLSGGNPLFPASDLRDGYLRADPNNPIAVLEAVLKARDLVGNFDKPRYINFTEALCAHSRSSIVGCRRCLDVCPTNAITPSGDHVTIDAGVCAGCGQCAAICPTGAAAYALPPADALMRKLRAMLSAYREAGGVRPMVLFYDDEHGSSLIDALARHGDGLPANVLPVTVNEITQIGLESIAAAFAYGAGAVRLLLRSKPRHDTTGLAITFALVERILVGLGFGMGRAATIETDDPFALGTALRSIRQTDGVLHPASFSVVGGKREVMRLALNELHRVSPEPVDVIALPQGAPFGAVEVDGAGCTLCLSCVSACPTGALSADPERPALRFTEDICVQCGLCTKTCPEKVIRLSPQIDFRAPTAGSRVLKEEDPFLCVRCSKPFGVKSSIARVTAKLEGQHWMFKDSSQRLEVIKMCADCRVQAMSDEGFNPFGVPERQAPRTTEDYLRDREIA
jgi:ferredoxin